MSNRQPFSERRYTDSELARILDEASRSEARAEAVGPSSEGYTLEEIRAIAREAGIDPSHVERAAAGLLASQESHSTAAEGASRLRESLSRTVYEEIVIPRSLTDEEMISLVHHLESVLPWSGVVRQAGNWVEWRDRKDRLYMGVVRGNNQTRVRLIDDQSGQLWLGGAVGLLAAGMALPLESVLGSVVGVIVGVVLGTTALISYLTRRTNATRAQLRELLGILERVE